MKHKICFIVQRYGKEVNGGAELQCREMAQRMCARYQEVHVLTTKAIDYMTWKDAYQADEEVLNGVRVHRFSVAHPRNQDEFNAINAKFLSSGISEAEEYDWMEKQGPAVPDLIARLKKEKDFFDAFIFFTYLYYPTAMGIREVLEKAILVPEAHEEPFLKMKLFEHVFRAPRFFFFNTPEEQQLVCRRFPGLPVSCEIGGFGIEPPDATDEDGFKKKYGLDEFLLYVGRVDEGKNCHILFQYFKEYKKRNKNKLKLVLVGKPVIPVPKDPDIVSLGFVEEQEKYNGIAAAQMLVLPSAFESLSIVVLEAMSLSVPVVVNGACSVLKGHCEKSNGALYYEDYFEFEGAVNYIRSHPETVSEMCANAKKYVEANYSWERIENKLSSLIERL